MHYLKFTRLNRGLTQAEVAKKLKISQGAYCDIERGQKKPRPRLYPELADVFQVPVEELTSRIHKLNPESSFK